MSNTQPKGSRKATYGVVTAVLFNTPIPKRDGSTYVGASVLFIDQKYKNEGRKNWAQPVVDNEMNASLFSVLKQLQPGDEFTMFEEKGDQFWNVKAVEKGFSASEMYGNGDVVQPGSGAPVAEGLPTAVGGVKAAPQAGKSFGGDKMRSKEQCMRGEAIVAAAFSLGTGASTSAIAERAEQLVDYIANGVQVAQIAPAPTVAKPAAPAPFEDDIPFNQAAAPATPVVAAPVPPVAPVAPVAPTRPAFATPVAPAAPAAPTAPDAL